MVKLVTVLEKKACRLCKGSGKSETLQKCKTCNGTGQIEVEIMR